MSTRQSPSATAGDEQYLLSGSTSARGLFNRRTIARDAAVVVAHLSSGMRLVDFGCGAGSLTCGFAEVVAPADVLGVDLSEDAIGRARALAEQSGLRNVQFSVANINDLELPPDSFDVTHFSGVLMYLKEPERALQLATSDLVDAPYEAERQFWAGKLRARPVAR